MRKLVFGSLNIDKVYKVRSIVKTGETISSNSNDEFCGGKGFNQAIALARAGSTVSFSGAVGTDGQVLMDTLSENGIDSSNVLQLSCASGHAIIQVDEDGRNCIIVSAAANGQISCDDIDRVLGGFDKGDLIVLQNEISNVDHIIRRASEIGMIIALNPSPIDRQLLECPLNLVDYLILNEHEGALLTGAENPEQILTELSKKYSNTSFVLTLGIDGAIYMGKDGARTSSGAVKVKAVDTTAAGDTFCGYFLHAINEGTPPQEALRIASAASAIAVTRNGAVPAIPCRAEVQELLAHAEFLSAP